MANWATAQEAVRQAVALAVGAADYVGADNTTLVKVVTWDGEAASGTYKRSGPLVTLELGTVRSKGQDETRYELVSDPSDPDDVTKQRLMPTYCGYRVFTVTVAIEAQDQRPAYATVGALASGLRTRLARGACHALLQAAEVAVVDIMPTLNADWVNQDLGRKHSKCLTDVMFGFNEHWAETDVSMGDFINEVHATGLMARPDGEDIEFSIAVTGDAVVSDLEPIVTETDEPVVVG